MQLREVIGCIIGGSFVDDHKQDVQSARGRKCDIVSRRCVSEEKLIRHSSVRFVRPYVPRPDTRVAVSVNGTFIMAAVDRLRIQPSHHESHYECNKCSSKEGPCEATSGFLVLTTKVRDLSIGHADHQAVHVPQTVEY